MPLKTAEEYLKLAGGDHNKVLALMTADLATERAALAVERAAGNGVTVSASTGYPGALEVNGIGFGWRSTRCDIMHLRALVATMPAIEVFTKKNAATVRQADTDTRFAAQRAQIKAETKAAKAAKVA